MLEIIPLQSGKIPSLPTCLLQMHILKDKVTSLLCKTDRSVNMCVYYLTS